MGADSVSAAKVVSAILNSTHKGIPDFTVTIPAELLAEQQRSQSIFTYVMVAIAAISLLVGGIGIMNIVLATVLERTREIGIRRAIGARRGDIVGQRFLLESVSDFNRWRRCGNRVRIFSFVADCARGGLANLCDAIVNCDRVRRVCGSGRDIRDLSREEGVANPDRSD